MLVEDETQLAETLLAICEKAGPTAAKLYLALAKMGGCASIKDIDIPISSKYTAAKWLAILGFIKIVKEEAKEPAKLCIKKTEQTINKPTVLP